MISLMLTVLNALTKNQLVLKLKQPIIYRFVPYKSSKTYPIETGISDFHKLVATVLKIFCKQKPKIIQSKSYRFFSEQLFRIELDKESI